MKALNMKKIIILFSSCLLLLASCKNLLQKTVTETENTDIAYISISPTTALSRNIYPSADDLDKTKLTNITLQGIWSPGEANETTKALVDDAETWSLVPSSIPIQTGTWNFTLTAKMNGVDFSGTITNKTIEKGDSPIQLTFELTATEEDCGGLDITVNITNASNNYAQKALVTLTDLSGAVVGEEDELTVTGGSVHFLRNLSYASQKIEAGEYYISFSFKNSDDSLPVLNVLKERVLIVAGITTTATKNITIDKVYELTYDTNDLADIDDYTHVNKYTRKSPTITLPQLSRTGFTFAGWYDNEDFEGDPITQIELTTPANIKSWDVYAKWTYTITYEKNDGSTATIQTKTAGVALTAPEEPTKTGYSFDGWFTNSSLAAAYEYTFGSAPTTGNFTLYAKWTLETYTITYNCIGGNTNQTTYTIEDSAFSLDVPSGTDPANPALEAESYYFNGWYNNSAYIGTAITEIDPATTHEDMELYAAQSNNIHVASSTSTPYAGSADNNGLFSSSPVDSIATAVSKIVTYNTPIAWIIVIDDNLTGTQIINNSSLTTSKLASSTPLQISGAGATAKVLNGGSLSEGNNRTTLTINTAVPVSITNLEITGGRGTVDSDKYYGGGLYLAANSQVDLGDGVKIYGNTCDFGGGVYVAAGATLCMHGTAIIGDTEKSYIGSSVSTVNDLYSISSNVSGAYDTWYCANYAAGNSPTPGGGGIYNLGTVALGYSSYTDEMTNNPSTLTGGIYNNASIRGGGIAMPSGGNLIISSGNIMYNSAVQSNTNGMGGGIYAKMASIVTFNDGKINNNYSSGSGAGVYLYCVNATDSGLATSGFYMNGGEIKNNHSFSNIAAVNCDRATFVMTGGTISGNKAHVTESNNETNGGIHIYGGTSSITGGTIKDNYDNNGNVTVAIDGDSDFTLGGTAEIPFDSGVANSIFSDSITITVSSPVSNSFTLIKWSSPDPSGYSTPPVILTGGNTSDYSKFSLTYNPTQPWTGTWVVGSDGTAQPGS